MKRVVLLLVTVSTIMTLALPLVSEARARYGSIRVGGYTSSGKGSHYIGGYVRSCHGIGCW